MYKLNLSNILGGLPEVLKKISDLIFLPVGIGSMIVIFSLFASQLTKASEIPVLPSSFKPVLIPDLKTTSNSRIMYQDSEGLMWIGTDNGLIKFDGYESTLYLKEKGNKHSLSNNFIRSIIEDKDKNLWVGTGDGLNRLNKTDATFEQYFIKPDPLDDSVNSSIYNLFIDNKHQLWVATATSIALYDMQANNFVEYQPWDFKFSMARDFQIMPSSFYQDDKSIMWVGTSGGGLIQFNPDDKSFVQFSSHKDNPHKLNGDDRASDFISVIKNLSTEHLLLTTGSGILKFNTTTKQTSIILADQNNKWSWAWNMVKDHDNNWWMATQNGLLKLSADLNQLIEYGPSNIQSLAPEFIAPLNVFVDRENNKWVSYENAGLFYSANSLNNLEKIELKKDTYGESHSRISSVLETTDKLWVGSGKGLTKINKENGALEWFDLKENNDENQRDKQKTSLGGVHDLHLAKDNSLWLARTTGLSVITPKGEVTHIPTLVKGLTNHFPIRAVVVDYLGQVWAPIFPFGLTIYDTTKQEFNIFEKSEEMGIGRSILTLKISDDRKQLYIIDDTAGLFRYNIETGQYKKYTNTIDGTFITGAQKINDETILLTYAENYVKEVHLLNGEVKTINLPITNVGCIVKQNEDDFWLTQYDSNLYHWNKSTGNLKQYNSYEGIPKNGLTGEHCGQSSNGGLWFASHEGLLYSNKNSRLSKELITPNTIITNVRLGDKKIKPDFYSSSIVNSKSKSSTYSFDYNQGPLFINFSSLSFMDPMANKYKYRVKGLRDDWIKIDAKNNEAILSYIPPGKYQFEVLGSNAAGIWSKEPATFNFEVLPPLWLTWWAKTIYFVVFFTLIISFYLFRTRTLKRQTKLLEKTVSERTTDLANEKAIVEKLLVKKHHEFANMSHEFRTPLTLILGPIEQLIKKCGDDIDKNRLNTIQRNANRLLRMVDQLLNIEIFRVKAVTPKVSQNSAEIIQHLVDAFSDLASDKEIKLHCKSCAKIICKLVPDTLEKIVLNLLSNAVKYTKAGGSISVETQRTSNNQLRIIVSDTGIGVEPNNLKTIFERYSRVMNDGSEKVIGAGIGLALVKELVEFHQGDITVESILGEGTTFIVNLPIEGEVEQVEFIASSQTDTIAMELMNLSQQKSVSKFDNEDSIKKENRDQATILIIEDNVDMLRYIAESLEGDYQIITAQDGKQGIDIAIQEVPDLIISDIMMPKMDGYQVTNELRNNEVTDQIPIILLTARGDKESRLKGWYEKADEYLSKPFDIDELKVRINNLLEIRNIIKKRFAETVFVEAQTRITHETLDIDDGRSEQQQKFILKLNNALESIYTESNTSIADFASAVAMSERQLFRKLKSILDLSPSEYLRRYRLEKSKLILEQGKSVNFVTFEVGFSTQSNFAKCFKAQFGMSPTDYKKAGSF